MFVCEIFHDRIHSRFRLSRASRQPPDRTMKSAFGLGNPGSQFCTCRWRHQLPPPPTKHHPTIYPNSFQYHYFIRVISSEWIGKHVVSMVHRVTSRMWMGSFPGGDFRVLSWWFVAFLHKKLHHSVFVVEVKNKQQYSWILCNSFKTIALLKGGSKTQTFIHFKCFY